MDPLTLRFYSDQATRLAQQYEAAPSSIARYFATAFPAGCRVIDIGAGSGRDLSALITQGYEGYGVEPVEPLRAEALARHPELDGRLIEGALPTLGAPFGGDFAGVVCSAVLMHVPETELFDCAFALRRLLTPHGRLLISLPWSRPDLDTEGRDPEGRLFSLYTPEYLQLLFERIGFQLIGRWDGDDALGRAAIRWYTLLFELRTGGPLRPVDQIEGILNRDRKEATYKLALFRALAELATQEPRIATWRQDGRVGVPVQRLAEKWLFYYWPLLASERFIPQSRTEASGSAKQLKFRKALATLIAPYRNDGAHGGLSSWYQHLNSGRLPDRTQHELDAALAKISQAIVQGPVEFAGGALETGTVFTHDRSSKQVLLSADLWKEFTLLGHWIIDAVILRWAELTEEIAHRQGMDAGSVLALLRARPEPERATRLARQIFQEQGIRLCTWSGKELRTDFVVDHVIPFSLWANNDLWNLLPADARINGQKSDRLPSTDLLLSSKERIVAGWRVLREVAPQPFQRQAEHLLGRQVGRGTTWEGELFSRLREAVELTALQRGVERWAPS